MKKKTQKKLMFKKMEVMELTSKDLLKIQGGIEVTGVDLPTITIANNGGVYGNNGGGSR